MRTANVDNEAIVKRHAEIVRLVSDIIDLGVDDPSFTFYDVAKILVDKPAAAVMIALIISNTGEPEDVSALLTALIYEEILQDASPVSMVRKQRRLH